MRNIIFKYVQEKYNSQPEYLWIKYPNYAIFRHNDNNKWYGVIMNISKSKLSINESGIVDILVVKCDKLLLGSFLQEKGFFPAYHMNKANWITILLDGSVSKEEIFKFIDMSFYLTKNKS